MTVKKFPLSFPLLAAALLAAPAVAQDAQDAPAPDAKPLVTLDDRFDVELQLQGTTGDVADVGGEHGKALRLRNDKGLPMVRLKNVGTVTTGDLGAAPTVTLDYKTDAWGGRFDLVLNTFHQPTNGRTFELARGPLDAGGPGGGRLVADGQWHTASATLPLTDDGKKIPPGTKIPLYLFFAPTGSGDLPHETLIDDINIYPGGAAGAADAPAAAEVELTESLGVAWRDDWTSPDARPMPTYADGNRVDVPAGGDVQAALDAAKPGDVITLAAGTYAGGLKVATGGTADRPVVLRAAEPGAATITNAADGSPTFSRDGKSWSAPVDYRVRWAVAGEGRGGRNLFEYPDRAALEAFETSGRDTKKKVPGPPEGFAWEGGTLYVRLLDGADPNAADVSVHRDYGGDASKGTSAYWRDSFENRRANGALIVVDAPHVVVQGLRLHLAPEVAVQVNADDVAVVDCLITSSHKGVDAYTRKSPGVSADRLRVEHCEYGAYPTYQWARWGRQEHPADSVALWNALYDTNLFATFLHYDGRDTRVVNNHAYECFDAVERHTHERGGGDAASDASEFAYNLVRSCADETFEFDSTARQNLRVHHNVLMDAYVPLALSPVQGGGLTIDHNLVYVSPEYGLFPSALLKFDAPWRKHWVSTPTKDTLIAHNTLVNARGFLYWTGEDHQFTDVAMVNNLVYVRIDKPWNLGRAGLVPRAENLLAAPRVESSNLPHLLHLEGGSPFAAPVPPSDPKSAGPPVLPTTGDAATATSAPRGPAVDFALAADSPAVDAGLDVPALARLRSLESDAAGPPDLGAIELGEEWRFPRPGPRWMAGEAWPPLPRSLDPKWVGMD